MASGLFSYTFPEQGSFIEAYVVNIDPLRSVCSVKTATGQLLSNVTWLNTTSTPLLNSKVLLSTSLGYPIVLGEMPSLGIPSQQISISGNRSPLDAGNSSMTKSDSLLNPRTPNDMLTGDQVFTSEGNSLLGILRSGSIIARASNLAQIVMSRLGSLVRIVGSNYQRFSDVSSRVASNTSGRLYEWFGADKDISRGRTNLERYNEAYGDVAFGEVAKGSPTTVLVEDYPIVDNRVRQYWLKNTSGLSVMVETLYEDGKLDIKVTSPSGIISEVIIDPAYIKLDFDSTDSTVILDTAGTRIDSKGHYMHIDSTGVHLG